MVTMLFTAVVNLHYQGYLVESHPVPGASLEGRGHFKLHSCIRDFGPLLLNFKRHQRHTQSEGKL